MDISFLQLQASLLYWEMQMFQEKVKSSVHCHATEFDYHNLSELAIRTEVASVDCGMEEDEQFPEEE